MKKRILFLSFIFLFFPMSASSAETGLFLKDLSANCLKCGNCGFCDIVQTVGNVMEFMLGMLGVVAVFMFVWGGADILISRGVAVGDEKNKQIKGVTRIQNTVKGVVIVLSAWLIVNTIIIAIQGPAGKNQAEKNLGGDTDERSRGVARLFSAPWDIVCEKSFADTTPKSCQ